MRLDGPIDLRMPYHITMPLEAWTSPMGSALVLAIIVIVLIRRSGRSSSQIDTQPAPSAGALSVRLILIAFVATFAVTFGRYFVSELYLSAQASFEDLVSGVRFFGPTGGVLGLIWVPLVSVTLAATLFRHRWRSLGLTFKAILISVLVPFAISFSVFVAFQLQDAFPGRVWLFRPNVDGIRFEWPLTSGGQSDPTDQPPCPSDDLRDEAPATSS